MEHIADSIGDLSDRDGEVGPKAKSNMLEELTVFALRVCGGWDRE